MWRMYGFLMRDAAVPNLKSREERRVEESRGEEVRGEKTDGSECDMAVESRWLVAVRRWEEDAWMEWWIMGLERWVR